METNECSLRSEAGAGRKQLLRPALTCRKIDVHVVFSHNDYNILQYQYRPPWLSLSSCCTRVQLVLSLRANQVAGTLQPLGFLKPSAAGGWGVGGGRERAGGGKDGRGVAWCSNWHGSTRR